MFWPGTAPERIKHVIYVYAHSASGKFMAYFRDRFMNDGEDEDLRNDTLIVACGYAVT